MEIKSCPSKVKEISYEMMVMPHITEYACTILGFSSQKKEYAKLKQCKKSSLVYYKNDYSIIYSYFYSSYIAMWQDFRMTCSRSKSNN